jgi:DNA-binding NarL/FixJ family response regulator
MEYSVVIVDDHILIAKAITNIIDSFPNYKVLYEAENGKVLMEKFKNRKNIPDIILLDISMPVMDGFDTAKWLKQHHPDVLIMVLSMQDDDSSLIKMIKASAKGYLLKNIHPDELHASLNTLVAKGHYYPEWAASKVFLNIAQEQKSKSGNEVKFTEREIEFLKHCCTERTYKQIADIMCCSTRTVEGYRDSLFEKLGLKTRVGLAVYALKSGIELYSE